MSKPLKRPGLFFPRVKQDRKRKIALNLYDAAKALLSAKGSHARFYSHMDLVKVIRKIDNYKKRIVTSK